MSKTREWRVSFTAWPHHTLEPSRTERITSDEDSALLQMQGLLSMLADHELRPCDKHVWEPKLEMRTVEAGEWDEPKEEKKRG